MQLLKGIWLFIRIIYFVVISLPICLVIIGGMGIIDYYKKKKIKP